MLCLTRAGLESDGSMLLVKKARPKFEKYSGDIKMQPKTMMFFLIPNVLNDPISGCIISDLFGM